jgi:sigma-B regulation protein RsbU (phosphoserine phosphatase)
VLNAEGEGEFISAAHNVAFLYRSAQGEIEELVSNAHFLGMFGFATWQGRPFHLFRGDVLIVYSDGLTDAENTKGEMFGEKRLKDIIRGGAPSGSGALTEGILRAIEMFTEGMPQNDDITFLTVGRV